MEALPVRIVLGLPATEYFAIERAQRRRGYHCFRAPANPHEHVDRGIAKARGDGHSDIAVGKKLHASADGTDFLDERFMTRPIEDGDGRFFDVFAERLGGLLHVVGHRRIEIYRFRGGSPDRDLFHVRIGGTVERTLRPCGDDGNRVGSTKCHGARALEGVDGNLHERTCALTELLADEELGCFVLCALADDYFAVEIDSVEVLTHRIHRRLVCRIAVPPTDPSRGRYSADLRHAHEFER